MDRHDVRHLARCPICRATQPRLGASLRGQPVAPMTELEQARTWRAIERRLQTKQPWRPRLVPWARGLGRRRPALAWAPAVATAAAAAILLVLAPLHLAWEGRPLIPAHVAAHTTIETVDAGLAGSVLVLDTPAGHMPIIWVTEPAQPERQGE